jgi:hypothetical protein
MRRLPLGKEGRNEKGIVGRAGYCIGGSRGYLTNNVWSGTEII